MPDGFDVHPDQLRRGAADLRADADGLDGAGLEIGAALDQVSEAAGPGPLTGAASQLSGQLDRALQAVRTSLEDCAGAVEASSTEYLASDGRSASGLGGVAIPGFDAPR